MFSLGRQRIGIHTWNFNIHTDTPVRGSFRIIYVQIAYAYLLHSRDDFPGLVVTRHANLLSISRILGRIE